jgi:hypothetical protein
LPRGIISERAHMDEGRQGKTWVQKTAAPKRPAQEPPRPESKPPRGPLWKQLLELCGEVIAKSNGHYLP